VSMEQAYLSNMNPGLAICEQEEWLATKVLKRQSKESLLKNGLSLRAQRAGSEAQAYRDTLKGKAELRDQIRTRMLESMRAQEAQLRAKANAYRERLRHCLPQAALGD
jgi:hypothetical protein